MEYTIGGDYTYTIGGDYTLLKDSGIPRHVVLRWVDPDNRYAEITYGYSGTKRHKILAEKLLPWPYDPKAAKVADTPAVAPAWTPEELTEFDRLTHKVSSQRQMDRIEGRMEMGRFVEKHGKEKCDAMWSHLTGGRV